MHTKWFCAVDKAIRLSDREWEYLEEVFWVEHIDLLASNKEQFGRFDILLIHTKLPDEILESFNQCKYIGIRAHNTDYVNSNYAQNKGIAVRGLPQVGEHAVAEHTFSLIFALTKQIISSHNNTRAGDWRKGLAPNIEVRGKNLGIIGNGKIGNEVAVIGRALGMYVLIASRRSDSGQLSLEEVLQQSDIITLHASTKNNKGALITKAQIDMMKDGAIIINTARGSLINYDDLSNALITGKISGAGLDVYPEEPYINDQLINLPNVVCTPHIAFYTRETIIKMNKSLLEQAVSYYKASSK